MTFKELLKSYMGRKMGFMGQNNLSLNRQINLVGSSSPDCVNIHYIRRIQLTEKFKPTYK